MKSTQNKWRWPSYGAWVLVILFVSFAMACGGSAQNKKDDEKPSLLESPDRTENPIERLETPDYGEGMDFEDFYEDSVE